MVVGHNNNLFHHVHKEYGQDKPMHLIMKSILTFRNRRYLYAIITLTLLLLFVLTYTCIGVKDNAKYEAITKLVDNILAKGGNVEYRTDQYSNNVTSIYNIRPTTGKKKPVSSRVLDNISRIECSFYQPSVDDITLLGALENPDSLTLSYVCLSDPQFQAIGNYLSALKNLLFIHSTFSPNGGKHLSKLHNLDFLHMYDTKISDSDLVGSGGLPIRHLGFSSCDITDRGLKNMLPLDNIEEVSLYDIQISDNITDFFNSCPKLRKIDIYFETPSGKLTCKFLRDMTTTSVIQSICLCNVDLDDELLAEVERFSNLKVFWVISPLVTKKSLPVLERLSQRMSVNVSNFNEDFETVFRFEKGKSFYWEHIGVKP